MTFQQDHKNARLYFERQIRTTFSRILGFLIVLFIISASGQGFGAWANWEKNDGNVPDGIQDYLGLRGQHSIIDHTAAKIEIIDGRIRMFSRMYGDPETWTVEQKQSYVQLENRKMEAVAQYQQLLLRYKPYHPAKTPDELAKKLLIQARR